eukprot:gene8775-18149_t
MAGCVLNYLPIYMKLKLDTSGYDDFESTPLSQSLNSRSFQFSIILSIGATIPMILDFILDAFSSLGRGFHPAQLVIWLLFISNLALNVFIIDYVAYGLRIEYWGATHSVKVSMLFSSGLYIQNAYGPLIWKLNKIVPIVLLLFISQALGAFSPFNSPTTEQSWIHNIRLKYKLRIKLSTDEIYCTLNLVTFAVAVAIIWGATFFFPTFTGLECNEVGVIIQTNALTAFTVILTVLNVRYIRAKLEFDKAGLIAGNLGDSITRENNNDNNSNNNSGSQLIDDIQGSCQSAVDILNDLLVYERLSEDRVQIETKVIDIASFLKRKIETLRSQARSKLVTLRLILPQGPVEGHENKKACIEDSISDNGVHQIYHTSSSSISNTNFSDGQWTRFIQGLFPTQEQLELLGVFLDHKIRGHELQAFWRSVGTNEWDQDLSVGLGLGVRGDDDEEGGGRDKKGGCNGGGLGHETFVPIGVIIRHFPSISRLSLSLEAFIRQTRCENEKNQQKIIRNDNNNGNNNNNHNGHHNKNINNNNDNDNDDDNYNDKDKARDTESASEYYVPVTPLSELLSSFRHSADLQGDGIYFLCDLEERTALAAAIDHVENMSFRDKYMFCMAPVSTDNIALTKWYVHLAEQYAEGGDVLLLDMEDMTLTKDLNTPRTPEQLLKLESIHQMIDLYIWLGRRFDSFVDVSLAVEECKLVCIMVDSALRTIGPKAKTSRKKDKNRRKSSKSESNNIDDNSSFSNSSNMKVEISSRFPRKVKEISRRNKRTVMEDYSDDA